MSRKLDVSAGINNKYVDKFYYCFKYGTWYSNKIIAHAKYVSSHSFNDFIGDLCSQSMHKHNLVNIVDCITYSPRRASQVRYYGFDQSKEIALARQVAMYLISDMLSMPLASIGNIFGKDHATVIYAKSKISEDMKKDKKFAIEISDLKQMVKGK